ncbi:MAG: hypothetical protein RLZZ628_1606 [Bacteroidota bacterium]|jgi:hypothetical protein
MMIFVLSLKFLKKRSLLQMWITLYLHAQKMSYPHPNVDNFDSYQHTPFFESIQNHRIIHSYPHFRHFVGLKITLIPQCG